jgi:hypothetical protein
MEHSVADSVDGYPEQELGAAIWQESIYGGQMMKTSELTGHALDWAVAKCESITLYRSKNKKWMTANYGEFNHRHGAPWYSPSTYWAQGGPIIEREGINLEYAIDPEKWCACIMADQEVYGPTLLIAAMRCYVASKLGDEIDIPKELT